MIKLYRIAPLALFAPLYFSAQDIKGTVIGRESGEAVTDASILLQPANKKIKTGLDGTFKLSDLPEGNYTLTISHPLFKSYTQPVSITGKGDVKLDILLSDRTSKDISEVVLQGIRKQNTENMARRVEQKSPELVNVVSGAAMQISPDLTVANVVRRISGLSVERSSNGEGQYAIVRGMDKRYNYTLVNGIKIPSPDNRNRYVPLDIFPSDLLDRLEVYKSLLPNMEGDAVGGAVNMVMKSATDRREINVNLAAGYSQYLFKNKFQSFPTAGINFLSPYERFGKNYSATAADFPNANYKIENLAAMPNFSGGISMGKRFFNNKFGILAAASYQNNDRMTESTFYPSANVDVMKYAVITSVQKRKYFENQQRLGAHVIFDYKFNDNNKISLYNTFVQLREAQLRETITYNASNVNYNPAIGSADISYGNRARLTEQRIWNSTLKGEHKIIPTKLSMDWALNASSADNHVPDQADYGTLGTERNYVLTHTVPSNATRSWLKNTDTDYSGFLNFKYRFAKKTDLQIGGMYRDKKRSNFYNAYTLYPTNTAGLWGTAYTGYDDIGYDVQNPQGSVNNSLTYTAFEKVGAGYAMIKTEVEDLEIIGGLRAENTDQGYDMIFQKGEDNPKGAQKYTDYLPSASVKYALDHHQNLHATYFRSINRPGFFELVPSSIIYEDYMEQGNPNLKHAVADNIDLRYELFPKPSDQLLLGVFYKKIKNPIEYTIQPGITRPQDLYYTPGNFGNATNYGAELDVVKFFNKFGFKANYTYTNSKITTPKSMKIRDAAGNLQTVLQDQTRPLYGQSAHIANLSLLYKNQEAGWDAQVAGSYTGPRISTVSQFLDNDIWQKGFVQLDFSVEKKLRNNITLFAKANNLLNTPAELFIKGENSKNANIEGQELNSARTLIRKDFYKQNYLIGIRFKL